MSEANQVDSRQAGKIVRPGQALLHGSLVRIKIPLGPPLKKGEESGFPPFVKGGRGDLMSITPEP